MQKLTYFITLLEGPINRLFGSLQPNIQEMESPSTLVVLITCCGL